MQCELLASHSLFQIIISSSMAIIVYVYNKFELLLPRITEAITSLYEIDSDLLDIKSVVCSVLKLAKDFGNIHFAKCSRFSNLAAHTAS
ncbi:unnamed protein product [Citrullus colocynthis]|uniref:Uncharacterized protein n=1 Tax=Citrullus colocynthis TaxID=252529 RepID=A0ABP0YVD6_9ROSI